MSRSARIRVRMLMGFLALALAAPPPARGGDIVAYRSSGTLGAIDYEAMVVWGQGEYLLDLWARLGTESQNLAKNRQVAEAALERKVAAVFLQSVLSLPVSSRENVHARLKADPALLKALERLAAAATKVRSSLAEGNEDLRLRYALPLFGEGGLLSLVAPGGSPSPFDRYLGFVPSAGYTGLVIYAQGSYPAWGREGAEAALAPCLLPRIYDAEMNLVYDASRADRSRLLSWGPLAYSNDLDEVPFLERIGGNPLRTVARGVFGVGNTDILVSREVAVRLLSREDNIRILSEGRILVILDAEAAPPPPEVTGGDGEPLEELAPERPPSPTGLKVLTPAPGR